jgi:hypothetical protein
MSQISFENSNSIYKSIIFPDGNTIYYSSKFISLDEANSLIKTINQYSRKYPHIRLYMKTIKTEIKDIYSHRSRSNFIVPVKNISKTNYYLNSDNFEITSDGNRLAITPWW